MCRWTDRGKVMSSRAIGRQALLGLQGELAHGKINQGSYRLAGSSMDKIWSTAKVAALHRLVFISSPKNVKASRKLTGDS